MIPSLSNSGLIEKLTDEREIMVTLSNAVKLQTIEPHSLLKELTKLSHSYNTQSDPLTKQIKEAAAFNNYMNISVQISFFNQLLQQLSIDSSLSNKLSKVSEKITPELLTELEGISTLDLKNSLTAELLKSASSKIIGFLEKLTSYVLSLQQNLNVKILKESEFDFFKCKTFNSQRLNDAVAVDLENFESNSPNSPEIVKPFKEFLVKLKASHSQLKPLQEKLSQSNKSDKGGLNGLLLEILYFTIPNSEYLELFSNLKTKILSEFPSLNITKNASEILKELETLLKRFAQDVQADFKQIEYDLLFARALFNEIFDKCHLHVLETNIVHKLADKNCPLLDCQSLFALLNDFVGQLCEFFAEQFALDEIHADEVYSKLISALSSGFSNHLRFISADFETKFEVYRDKYRDSVLSMKFTNDKIKHSLESYYSRPHIQDYNLNAEIIEGAEHFFDGISGINSANVLDSLRYNQNESDARLNPTQRLEQIGGIQTSSQSKVQSQEQVSSKILTSKHFEHMDSIRTISQRHGDRNKVYPLNSNAKDLNEFDYFDLLGDTHAFLPTSVSGQVIGFNWASADLSDSSSQVIPSELARYVPRDISQDLLLSAKDYDAFIAKFLTHKWLYLCPSSTFELLGTFFETLFNHATKLLEMNKLMLKISKSYSVLLFSDLLFLRFKIHQYYELLGLKTKRSEHHSQELEQLESKFFEGVLAFVEIYELINISEILRFVSSSITYQAWTSTRSFITIDLRPETIKHFEGSKNLPSNSELLKPPKNSSYGLRSMKMKLQQITRELYKSFGTIETSSVTLRIMSRIYPVALADAYQRYQFIKPSRVRFDQYQKEILTLVDLTSYCLRIFLAETVLMYTANRKLKSSHICDEDIPILMALQNIWWVLQSLQGLYVLLTASAAVLVEFLQKMIDNGSKGLQLDEAKVLQNLKILEYFEKMGNQKVATKEAASAVKRYNAEEIKQEDFDLVQQEKHQGDSQSEVEMREMITQVLNGNCAIMEKLHNVILGFSQKSTSVSVEEIVSDFSEKAREAILSNDKVNRISGIEIETQKSTKKLEPLTQSIVAPDQKHQSLRNELDAILKQDENPLRDCFKSNYYYDLREVEDMALDQQKKSKLVQSILTPETISNFILKRPEFTNDSYPALKKEEVDAQQLIAPVLTKFCQKFGLGKPLIPQN